MERIDDLQYGGLRIIQDPELACFSADAVALVSFARIRKTDRVVDLGAGNGILSILGQGKTGAAFVGIEKQRALCDMAARSAEMNGQKIPFFCMDVSEAPSALGRGMFSAAVCNPPYYRTGDRSRNASRALSRHADALSPFLDAAFQLLDNGGNLFMCYPCAFLTGTMALLCSARLEPKRINFVAASEAEAPYLALIEAKKLAKPGLKIGKNMYLNRMS